jgi:hypothetical protein
VSAECPRNPFAACSGQDALFTHDRSEAKRDEPRRCPYIGLEHQSVQAQVRERSAAPPAHRDCRDGTNGPAHPSNRLVAQLNESWKVIYDPLQWILQQRKGNPRKKNSGWRSRSFCRTQEALLRCIREYCGEIDVEALAKLQALPAWHPDWDHRNEGANLDVRGTDQAKADAQSEPLMSLGLEVAQADDQRPRSSQSALS